jgi:murein DD-endopeptidase MepM/ murein hydrolase activator NlpD
MIKQFKKLKRVFKKTVKMEAQEAIEGGIKFVRTQIKIRPRIRLFSKFIIILILAFEFSSSAVSYLKPREAEIKINGQAILVAENRQEDIADPQIEISYAVNSRRSPFEFQKPVDGYISQGYRRYHPAYDIATALGTPIHSLGSGIVEFAGRVNDGKGNIVIIDHGDGLKSLYAHMGKIDVGMGNVVNTNSTIGTVGLTGRTTGPHVHLEIYDRGIAIDPGSVLP